MCPTTKSKINVWCCRNLIKQPPRVEEHLCHNILILDTEAVRESLTVFDIIQVLRYCAGNVMVKRAHQHVHTTKKEAL